MLPRRFGTALTWQVEPTSQREKKKKSVRLSAGPSLVYSSFAGIGADSAAISRQDIVDGVASEGDRYKRYAIAGGNLCVVVVGRQITRVRSMVRLNDGGRKNKRRMRQARVLNKESREQESGQGKQRETYKGTRVEMGVKEAKREEAEKNG